MPSQTEEFLALQAKWDKKLKDSGFSDIEQRDGNLKTWSSLFPLRHTGITIEAKQEYYRAAGHFLHSYDFTAFERKIWELHVEGVSIRDIVKKLESKGNIKTYKRQVHETLQRLVKTMMQQVQKDNEDARRD